MPLDTPGAHGPAVEAEPLDEDEAQDRLRGICFKTGPPRTVGVELEWLIHDRERPEAAVSHERLTAAADAVRATPLDSALTFEPGGQLELSSRPAGSLTACVDAVSADMAAVRTVLARSGLEPVGLGVDPWQPPRRLLKEPRYAAMEAALDRSGDSGRAMMCTSASVQVCVDAGEEEPGPLGFGRRWQLGHLLGAVLVAAFANSPFRQGVRTGWRSTRQALWADLDPARSLAPPVRRSPRDDWAGYVLDTPVMCIRSDDGTPWAVPEGLTFRDWIRGGGPRPAVRADLDYHVTTLFPPVRPRGHLELRMIDAQSGPDGWLVPLAVTTALFDDPEAAETVYRTVKPLAETAGPSPAPRNPLWTTAARDGLADPELAAAAKVCFAAASRALPGLGASGRVQDAVAAFTDRYVVRGRCPADDLTDPTPMRHGRGPAR
ncbi:MULTISPECIES: ergothioneine biosynthesis glutamate--cysteine ligase EgtA [unclassified Streptomyces]|uniref:ergothioneine biosynthesis glutamate--cysteine ligase EgtA n=1 Tax=unclassified Streptomyces TaxID=2593676 RepID=UPI0001C18F2F|nr:MULTISPECIES: ergothioneine biosynthesis glutamate--cysteine ligase EgtA [unclassified Streptomyces]AEN14000.1 glutamate/cysteine ligase family protein [Streptomyces sp. SirexAA-E]MYR67769.1 ergothioneine biosynthesis glutamate--cysteine ligase EgtA [Streptomyces sp. SID4939]MYR99391.1 ergothioneine biosynthesis glutamate--cysteine ligase EgtA [Streptomyces sp. SID4940]MYT67889.1 ergothioneine biosynthesis glutamate--cysteine ligase EgtA [Streptomyces sp. SID8357]MYT86732.1 ergothioneine bi